jgi:hypothetical protein
MNRTKKQFLGEIRKGHVSVELIYTTTLYRVAVGGDADPENGVFIHLGPGSHFVVEDYLAVRAHVDGREFRLTQAETNVIVGLIAKTMRLRGHYRA